ncbi:Ribonuclease H-like superfamily protein [Gossypium australe]|uniref:Ribonuclease H-like superfamily protein n=1 Tax=Gossypium australe TaxID=47621 RepID=A0A5B6W8W7_9ROSI|nr:Ribonuclease H-like superfamily protein [Gossypium australe]
MTSIVLIAKVANPVNLKNFRPISVQIYKVITKTMANRLQKVLDACIDKTQSAFVPGEGLSSLMQLAVPEGTIKGVKLECKQTREQIATLLGVRTSRDPEKYLGLPNMLRRNKKRTFQIC